MTREERANDYAEHNQGKYTNEFGNLYHAYLKGAEEETKELTDEIVGLEKENAELEQKVELWKKASENNSYKAFQFEKENSELKARIDNLKDGLSIQKIMVNEFTVEIDNPCYHCYTGAIGECYGIGCKYVSYPWNGDLEEDYKVEVEKEDKSK